MVILCIVKQLSSRVKNVKPIFLKLWHINEQPGIYQATSVGSQQYLCPQSKADSLAMSVSLSVKSKSLAFPCILSGFEDLGSTGTPCCTAQRNRT